MLSMQISSDDPAYRRRYRNSLIVTGRNEDVRSTVLNATGIRQNKSYQKNGVLTEL